MQDEESLVRRAKEHDPEALTQIYEENFDKVYRYVVLKIGERTEAEDITQQVFLSAIKSISSFKWQGAPVSAWLYRIAHNQIVDYLRRKTKVPTVQLDESLASESDDPESLAEQKVEIEHLSMIMKRLTRAQQQVISLRFTAEMSIAECARAMGKSEGAIKALQHSAIAALRRELAAG
ncbi:MAG: sigma-70 family RNA polymerase sigma factor [Dehalococcoidales bacterium]|nr:sigma-70 family RNA polymerase sigma factor [Dehalococcoidales bacterium]